MHTYRIEWRTAESVECSMGSVEAEKVPDVIASISKHGGQLLSIIVPDDCGTSIAKALEALISPEHKALIECQGRLRESLSQRDRYADIMNELSKYIKGEAKEFPAEEMKQVHIAKLAHRME